MSEEHTSGGSETNRVLVVEDEPTTRALIEYKLKNSGYAVQSVSDGTEALALLSREAVDLIILDLMMPVMSGKELLVTLRSRSAFGTLPVIILTARTREEDIIEGLSLGADDFIKKPFSPGELVVRVRRLLTRKR